MNLLSITPKPRHFVVGAAACGLLVAGLVWQLPTVTSIASNTQFPLSTNTAVDNGAEAKAKAMVQQAKLPLYFEPNVGQLPEGVDFAARTPDFQLLLQGTQARMFVPTSGQAETPESSRGSSIPPVMGKGGSHPPPIAPQYTEVTMQPLGVRGKAVAHWQGLEPRISTSSYYRGSDPKQWKTGISHYGKVQYPDLYAGIDLAYYGNPQQLEYDFIVKPGADPSQIALGYSGISHITLAANGDANLNVGDQTLVQHKPIAYQMIDGQRHTVEASYIITDTEKGKATGLKLALAEWNPSHELIIDPVLSYSSLLGGNGEDGGYSIAVDNDGAMYVTGYTASGNFPPSTEETRNYNSVFISKLTPLGDQLLWTVFFDGDGDDQGYSIAVDNIGGVYAVGSTSSTNFPTLNAFDSVLGINDGFIDEDAFIVKTDDAGNLLFASYLGGGSSDYANSVAVDKYGDIYVTGNAYSEDFPITNYYNGCVQKGCRGAFVSKINIDKGLIYSGAYFDTSAGAGHGIAIDNFGNAYVVGRKWMQEQGDPKNFNNTDVFVIKVNTEGNQLIYDKSIGGYIQGTPKGYWDQGFAIAVDKLQNAYITGSTDGDFPTTDGAFDTDFNGGWPEYLSYDAFATKLDVIGEIVYSTYLGGNYRDEGRSIAVDDDGNIYITGVTMSDDFPITLNAISKKNAGYYDAFIVKLDSVGRNLLYGSYLGGEGVDGGNDIQLVNNVIYLVGDAGASGINSVEGFPITPNALTSVKGGSSVFITKLGTVAPPVKPILISPSGNISTRTPTYMWQAIAGATGYYLQVDDATKAKKIIQWYTREEAGCATDSVCSVTPSIVVDGKSKWWVIGRNEVGNGYWSNAMSFQTPPSKAVLVSPKGNIITRTPTYKWQTVKGATQYCLRVDDDIKSSTILQCYTPTQANCVTGSTCSAKPATAVSGNAKWWVQAKNAAGAGAWSTVMAFQTPPGKAVLTTPKGIISTTTPTYTWQAVPGATQYYLKVNDVTKAGKIGQWYTKTQAHCATGNTCYVTPTTVVKGKSTWQVQTGNAVGNGVWSNLMAFTAPNL